MIVWIAILISIPGNPEKLLLAKEVNRKSSEVLWPSDRKRRQ